MLLPRDVKHIQHPIEKKQFWCGAPWSRTVAFTSLDHAATNALKEGRYLACPWCLEEAQRILEVGTWGSEGHPMWASLYKLLSELYEETKLQSSLPTHHALYKEMVCMGEEIVPTLLLILDSLENPHTASISVWGILCALEEITDEKVHQEGEEGRFMPLIKRWIEWGRENNYFEE